jgi:acyl-coenzyme A synthetase/AMP-(fatty) acid ligase
MHERLHQCWRDVLDRCGSAVALVAAESGGSVTFNDLEALSCAWLVDLREALHAKGSVWAVALTDPLEWLTVCLAAIKVGAVYLPIEGAKSDTLREIAEREGAACLIQDAGITELAEARKQEGAFLIKLTSGTTGEPKALQFTELEMMADGGQIMRSMGITSSDRNYAVIPLGHSYGLGNLVMPFFIEGVPIVFGSSPFPQVMVEELARYRCSVLPLVPPLVKALSSVESESNQLAHLRLVLSAGSALKSKFARRFYKRIGLRVHNFYGSSETGGICFDRDGGLSEVESAIGQALDGVEVRVDQDGVIEVKSASLCHARYPSGVCRLHDFGYLDADSVLHLSGRSADIVKIAGRRLSLAEVESALCAVEGVTDAYVSSREGRTGEMRCVAVYAGDAEEGFVRATLWRALAHWKFPKLIRQVDTISYTARGKKDRQALEGVIDALIRR